MLLWEEPFRLVGPSTGAHGLMKCNNGCVFHYKPQLGNVIVWHNGRRSSSFVPNHQPFLLLQETNEIVAIKKFKDSEGKTLIKWAENKLKWESDISEMSRKMPFIRFTEASSVSAPFPQPWRNLSSNYEVINNPEPLRAPRKMILWDNRDTNL